MTCYRNWSVLNGCLDYISINMTLIYEEQSIEGVRLSGYTLQLNWSNHYKLQNIPLLSFKELDFVYNFVLCSEFFSPSINFYNL